MLDGQNITIHHHSPPGFNICYSEQGLSREFKQYPHMYVVRNSNADARILYP